MSKLRSGWSFLPSPKTYAPNYAIYWQFVTNRRRPG